MVKIRKLKDGIYSNKNERFEVRIDGVIATVTAITDFKFFELKKGESRKLNKSNLESYLNEELFSFKKQ